MARVRRCRRRFCSFHLQALPRRSQARESFGLSFQRLAAGLSPIVVGEWSTNGPRREITLWAGFGVIV